MAVWCIFAHPLQLDVKDPKELEATMAALGLRIFAVGSETGTPPRSPGRRQHRTLEDIRHAMKDLEVSK